MKPQQLSMYEHEVVSFSESDELYHPNNYVSVNFEGNPERNEEPKYLGISKTTDCLKASYYIGTAWIREKELYLSVKPKIKGIDYAKMFSMALSVNDSRGSDYFSKCYGISFAEEGIPAGNKAEDFLLLLVMHYVSELKKIASAGLRKGYITIEKNLASKIKGKVLIQKNINKNDTKQRLDKVYCAYQIYTEDIPENRLLKKALLISEKITRQINSMKKLDINQDISKLKAYFQQVSYEVDEHSVRGNKNSKMFRNYEQAIKIARMILRQEANGMDCKNGVLPPFWIDMTALFEMYVLAVLKDRVSKTIQFQVVGNHKTRCDYLDIEHKMIIDAKYKIWYSNPSDHGNELVADVRELSGYARDLKILNRMNADENYIPSCLIIYPCNDEHNLLNIKDFMKEFFEAIDDKKSYKIDGYKKFYKIGVKLPIECKEHLNGTAVSL